MSTIQFLALSTRRFSSGGKPETLKPAAEQSKERADLTFELKDKKFNLEIVVINDKVFIQDKKNQTVRLDTGVKVKNPTADQLKAIATKFLNPPNPNAEVSTFFNKVSPAKPAELENSFKVEQDLLTGATGGQVTLKLDSQNKFKVIANATQVSAELNSKLALGTSTNLSTALGYNLTNRRMYGNVSLNVEVANNLSISTKVGQGADGANLATVGAEFKF